MIMLEVFLIMKGRWSVIKSKSLHISMKESAKRPKMPRQTNRPTYKLSEIKLRVQCLQDLLVLLYFPLCTDNQICFKPIDNSRTSSFQSTMIL